jgi:hypothetical protein
MATRIGALDMLNLQSDEKHCLIRCLVFVLDSCQTLAGFVVPDAGLPDGYSSPAVSNR